MALEMLAAVAGKTRVSVKMSEGVYEGEAMNGRPDGIGRIYGPGYIVDGRFECGRLVRGTLQTSAERYEGQFLDGRRHGFGTAWWDGSAYSGEWQMNTQTGRGTFVYGNARYTGEFLDGKRHGIGRIDYGGLVYVGQFDSDVPVGVAFQLKDGRVLKLVWRDGRVIRYKAAPETEMESLAMVVEDSIEL